MFTIRGLTSPVNVAGLPALALPVPVNGPLPASVQLIGPANSEDRLLAAGAVLEQALRSLSLGLMPPALCRRPYGVEPAPADHEQAGRPWRGPVGREVIAETGQGERDREAGRGQPRSLGDPPTSAAPRPHLSHTKTLLDLMIGPVGRKPWLPPAPARAAPHAIGFRVTT